MNRADILAQIKSAEQTCAELRKLFPHCFDRQGRAIVASAHFPRRAARALLQAVRGARAAVEASARRLSRADSEGGVAT